MREAEDMNPPDADVPGALRGLMPAAPSQNVARSIWYQSGYQAGHGRLNLWRGSTIALALGMTALLGFQPMSNRDARVNQVVAAREPAPVTSQSPIEVRPPGSAGYARLLNSLMQDGPRSWTEKAPPTGNPHIPPSRDSRVQDELNLSLLN